MTLWLIPLIILVVVGSFMWIRPSPRDRRLAALRLDAIKLGLQVRQHTHKPQSEKNGVRDNITATSYTLLSRETPKDNAMQYRLVNQAAWDNDGLPDGYWWDSAPNEANKAALLDALQQHLPTLQDELLLLEADQRRVTMMVAERPSASAQNYHSFLQALLPGKSGNG